ncbi:MAG: epoxide hydrolase family protein [Myxococcota bacterium]
MAAEPFQVRIPDSVIEDLRARLKATRLAPEVRDADWSAGTPSSFLRPLVEYWSESYEWLSEQERLNSVSHFRAMIEGVGIHFVHMKSGRTDALPLLLMHGWPSSFVQMLDLLPLLTKSSQPELAFDVVAPSLPGYGFSDIPSGPGMSPSAMAPLMHRLMTEVLGYKRYAIRSSDLGAGVASAMGLRFPAQIVGSHTGGTNPFLQGPIPDDLTSDEQRFVENAQAWMQQEMAYAQLHASKPQTIAHALNDSPAGLASWLFEKFYTWADHDGDLFASIPKDALLTNLTIYWATETIGSSMRLYFEAMRDTAGWGTAQVPTGYLMPTNDMFPTPRSWMERQGPITHWTEAPSGGHFMEWEQPTVVARDLRAFFTPLVRS